MIEFEDLQSFIQVDEKLNHTVEKVIQFALEKERVQLETETSLLYVDNKEIKSINYETRNIDKETDVLSFPMINYPDGKVFKEVYDENSFYPEDFNEGRLVLGEIVLSLEKAFSQSEEFSHSFEREVCYLCIHSLLHLLGYDHMVEVDKVIMRKREEEILNEFNIVR
ncbi:rRNA maturation RNase YbeY [Clostridium grantii]|uniref:Endoribonuclease YbeY n=1 Tax=Clostridium grantii DSM 8605 TaxID=1121316 RepID=A0A1M5XKU2_9CLOT|nr:rRNA maturation RNase YbeY [Clostridium grantii]SHI00465.1 probable rRNA maturation factor [Clostridium grantii DSM 8605]